MGDRFGRAAVRRDPSNRRCEFVTIGDRSIWATFLERAPSSRPQHDSAVVTGNCPLIFYTRDSCGRFHTAKTQTRTSQPGVLDNPQPRDTFVLG